ncbi:hypothetical protein GVN21_07455 [Caulobacter sp. SLTY]|uniref:hypothetical protein n=1 Tax=Caulobacter sp. SLTY TaxID=2683262 RepID=UPI001412C578|nr:hypothetical protein [Caulobacter sp. SLTY]NBB15190.1 hypothetical protein [Caulobacter sp. SLTY]
MSVWKIAEWVAVVAFLIALGAAAVTQSPMPLLLAFPIMMFNFGARKLWGKGPE